MFSPVKIFEFKSARQNSLRFYDPSKNLGSKTFPRQRGAQIFVSFLSHNIQGKNRERVKCFRYKIKIAKLETIGKLQTANPLNDETGPFMSGYAWQGREGVLKNEHKQKILGRGGCMTLFDKIQADKIAENLRRCQKFHSLYEYRASVVFRKIYCFPHILVHVTLQVHFLYFFFMSRYFLLS